MSASNGTGKIRSIDDLAETVRELKRNGRSVVHCHGVFDLLHPGHIRHFEAARHEGDVLVVTVTRDEHVNKGPGRPVFNQRLRAESIAALERVDFVAVSEWPTAVELIERLRPDVYAKGDEYANAADDITGKIEDEARAVQAVGGRIHFTQDKVVFSSTRLLNEYFAVYPDEARDFLSAFHQRHSSDDVIRRLKDLRRLKALVIGDAIVDEYCYCHVLGRSPKDVFMTTQFLREEAFAGGALAAANHAAGFCDEVHLITGLGRQDSREEFIRQHLKPNVQPVFVYRDDAPTTVKRRFLEPAFLRKMFEICSLNDAYLPELTTRELHRALETRLADCDVVIAADFGHGLLGAETVQLMCGQARFLAVNTQTNSANTGYNLITKYPRADYVCIDEPELRLATGDRFQELQALILEIGERLNCDKITITRGHEGAMTYDRAQGFTTIPVFSHEVVDTMGAGDAFLAVTAPCVAAGYSMDMAGFIGNAVGALAVRIVGNRSSVEPVPLFKFVAALLK